MTPADLQRIAFVTRRFGDLQGLRTVAYGATLLVGVSIQSVFPRDYPDQTLYLVLFANLLAGSAKVTLDRYYRGTFGNLTVQSGETWRILQPQFSRLPNFVVAGLMVDLMLASIFDVRIGIGAVVLFGLCLRTVIQDWPHRPHYAIGVAAAVAAVVVVGLAPPRGNPKGLLDTAVGQHFAVASGLIALAFVVIGLLDHRLLVQAMWRGPSAAAAERRPPHRLATMRILLAGSVAAILLVHFGVAGWSSHAAIVMGLFSVSLIVLTVVGSWPEIMSGLYAFKQGERSREAALLARVEGRASAPVESVPMNEMPAPDWWGHVVLPLAIACGSLIDIPLRGSGLPSFLALAIAASHLRIAIRDWPERKHYLLGAAAAAVGAMQHMFIATDSQLDGALSFLMLLSTAMLIEGLLDRRLESHSRRELSDNRHAHTI